ncbi:MAG TPA: leucyl/phenylalanyl-tRNA--protein transferase [Burkholderiaceae bacterium]|nr:leucyl/phenylalanyl-tRNA--protein transferase [Burkholderiaceae bacterium]
MNPILWLDSDTPLPDPADASRHGLLAAGHSLSLPRLKEAYRKGIFPWYQAGEPVLWWSPDPRMVLPCDHLRVSRSLAKRLRQVARQEEDEQPTMTITTNMAFEQVMQGCAQPVPGREQTWITPEIFQVYQQWHQQGQVHSLEVWRGRRLVGGLYGVCLGRFFFGESMFTREPDASKIALSYLIRVLQARGIAHVDCQQDTPHLRRLGARLYHRSEFLAMLEQAQQFDTPAWGRGRVMQSGAILP